MISTVQKYLAVRRAAGFARWATQRGEPHIRTETAIAWASQTASAAQRDTRQKTICCLARYLRAEEQRHELPPSNYFGYRKRRRVPYIYSAEEIRRLLKTSHKAEDF